MKISIVTTDIDGNASHRVENRQWLLNLLSSCLENGQEVKLVVDGGTVSAIKEVNDG